MKAHLVVGWPAIARLGARAGGKAAHLARLGTLEAATVLPAAWVPPTLDARTAARGLIATFRGAPTLIVRSSAQAEDGRLASLAGHFESRVCERTAGALATTIAGVREASLEAFARLLRRRGESLEAAHRRGARGLGLLVQPALAAERSGVYFARSPLHPGCGLAVATWGTCHPVVEGALPADTFVLDGERVIEERLAWKFEMVWRARGECGQPLETPLGPSWLHLPWGPGLTAARVPRGREGAACLTHAELARVVRAAAHVEAVLGFAPDLEFSFVGNELFVLQARPITTQPAERRARVDPGGPQIASPGQARGPLRRAFDPDTAARARRGDVVLVGATDPEYLPMFRRAAAILSLEGSPLSHTAIVARELGIPCLVGVDETRDGPFPEGADVLVDADHGHVSVRARHPPRVAPRPRPRATRGRAPDAAAVLAAVAARLGDLSPGPRAVALARKLAGNVRPAWRCAPTGSTLETAWRGLLGSD